MIKSNGRKMPAVSHSSQISLNVLCQCFLTAVCMPNLTIKKPSTLYFLFTSAFFFFFKCALQCSYSYVMSALYRRSCCNFFSCTMYDNKGNSIQCDLIVTVRKKKQTKKNETKNNLCDVTFTARCFALSPFKPSANLSEFTGP